MNPIVVILDFHNNTHHNYHYNKTISKLKISKEEEEESTKIREKKRKLY